MTTMTIEEEEIDTIKVVAMDPDEVATMIAVARTITADGAATTTMVATDVQTMTLQLRL